MQVDKRQALTCFREKLRSDLQALSASQQDAQSGATHEEARQEDPKDTRAIEAAYLARGLAGRVEALKEALSTLTHLTLFEFRPDDPIGLTALVELEDEDAIYFILPCAGGEKVSVDDRTVLALTPGSPLGAALIGKCVDDEVDLDLPARHLSATIVATA